MKGVATVGFIISLLCCLICPAAQGADWASYYFKKTPEGWTQEEFYDRQTILNTQDGTIEVSTKMVLDSKETGKALAPNESAFLMEIDCKKGTYKPKDYYHSDGSWKRINPDASAHNLYRALCLRMDPSAPETQPYPQSPGSQQSPQQPPTRTTPRQEADELINQSRDDFQKGNWDGVINKTTSALLLNPKSEAAYVNRAGAYVNKGMMHEAIEDCNNAVAINPKFGLAFNNRGFAYELLGQTAEAQSDYQTGCSLGTTSSCDNLKRLSGTSK